MNATQTGQTAKAVQVLTADERDENCMRYHPCRQRQTGIGSDCAAGDIAATTATVGAELAS